METVKRGKEYAEKHIKVDGRIDSDHRYFW